MIQSMRPLGLVLALLLIGLGAAGCDSNTSSDPEAPPVLEPDAFVFEADTFPETNDENPAVQPKAGTNVAVAATSVGVLSTVIAANLVIPRAVTAAALEAEPTVEDGTWIWRSSTRAEGTAVEFRLEGTPDGDRVRWRMFVTATNPNGTPSLDTFELYTAETLLNSEVGRWSLYYPIEGERRNVLDASYDLEGNRDEVRFTVADGARRDVGDTVLYTEESTTRSVVYTQVEPEREAIIEWDAETKAGFIQAPNYRDGVTSCWGPAPELANVECSR